MASPARKPLLIDLALQGGGAHGAFTWGVLDRLIEEPRLTIDGICGTSAGAMNAAVMASGWEHGGVDGAKAARWARMRIHCIASDRAPEVDASSKPITAWRFLQALRDEGRRSAGPFLEQHGANLGKRSTLDLDAMPAAC